MKLRIAFNTMMKEAIARSRPRAKRHAFGYLIILSLPFFAVAIVSPLWGAIFSISVPILFLCFNLSGVLSLLHFKNIYLLSLIFWGSTHCLGLLALHVEKGDSFTQHLGFTVSLYAFSLLLSPFLIFLFKDQELTLLFHSEKQPRYVLKATLFSWIILFILLVVARGILDSDSPVGFVISSIASPFFLISTLIVVRAMTLDRKYIQIFAVAFISVIPYSLFTPNRTALMLPLLVSVLALMGTGKFMNFSFLSKRTLAAATISIVCLILADVQKMSQTSLFLVGGQIIQNPELLYRAVFESNYFSSSEGTILYFQLLDNTIGMQHYSPGTWLLQLITTFVPRIFFTSKPEYDLSKVYFENGLIDRPLYFDFLFDRLIDSGLFGVIFYHCFYLCFVWIAWFAVTKYQAGFRGRFVKAVYLLNLIALFLVMRGPIIVIAWLTLFPNVVVICFLIKSVFIQLVKGRSLKKFSYDGLAV